MKYTIHKLNRTVYLNDELVNKYCEYDEIRETMFSIPIRTQFGHAPLNEEISDNALSELCNKILLSSLKALALLPEAVSTIENNKEQLSEAAINGTLLESKL